MRVAVDAATTSRPVPSATLTAAADSTILPWGAAIALGAWLCLTAVWPSWLQVVSRTQVMVQPLLLLTLAAWTIAQGQRVGRDVAIGRALWMLTVVSIAGWLPAMRSHPPTAPSPRSYQLYVFAYEAGLSALIAWQAAMSALDRRATWWTAEGWSRPLVVAPLLLAVRSAYIGAWLLHVAGMLAGAAVGVWQARRGWPLRLSERTRRLLPIGLFLVTGALVYLGGLRIAGLTGAEFPNASDDGNAYFKIGLAFSQEPWRFFTNTLNDQVFFTAYSVLEGLWFRLMGGPHFATWLLWHGAFGGLLAVSVYAISRQLTGSFAFSLVAGLLAVVDHVMLHLLSTINQETFFYGLIYLGLWLWSRAADTPAARMRTAFAAGIVMGVSVMFRTTSLLLPLLWTVAIFFERPRLAPKLARKQVGGLLLGCAIPLALLVIRHRIAWGYWTLSGKHSTYKIIQWNYALQLGDVHLYDIGLIKWLQRLAAEPHLLWQHVIPSWWKQAMVLWTHRGFGQMDIVQGFNENAPYQAAVTTVLSASAAIGAIVALLRRSRVDLLVLSMPLCFTSYVLLFYVLNSRYRSPFIPALYLLTCLGLSLACRRAAEARPARA